MSPTSDQKKAGIRYWERRRIAYNLLLVPPALGGWFLRGVIPACVGDEMKVGFVAIALLFAMCAIGANVCFSYAYVLEFWVLTDTDDQFWKKRGRSLVFAGGCLIGFVLAFIGGMQIAVIEYNGFP